LYAADWLRRLAALPDLPIDAAMAGTCVPQHVSAFFCGAPGEGKQFFFEKKNQKTFAYKACALRHRARQWTKVFASFFKKKRFPTSFAPDTNALPRGDRPLSALILYRDGGHGRAL
jgi:hypothetical protein